MIIRSVITAVRTLTSVPIPGMGAANEADSLPAFPLVGAFLGGCAAFVAWLVGGLFEWHAGAGVAGTAVLAWLTGGLHIDGLGDSVDGLAFGRARERRLEIMKDTHMGAFGTVAIVLALLVKAASLSRLAAFSAWMWVPVPFILSRTVLVLLSVVLPYARRDGGTARGIVGNARAWHLAAAGVAALVLCWALAGGAGLAFFAVSGILALVLWRWMNLVFGGITGDLLGMSNEVVECALLFVMAIFYVAG